MPKITVIKNKKLTIQSLRIASPNLGGGLGLDLDSLWLLKISIKKCENEKN